MPGPKARLVSAGGILALALTLITWPQPAMAQCGMMGSGGHDHPAAREPRSRKQESGKKQRESAVRLLGDEQGRRVLAETLLEDDGFLEDLLLRLLAIPEWRSFLSQEMSHPSSRSQGTGRDAERAVSYTCPMHPEVTSAKPGDCPKCGMALVRAASDPDR